MRAMQSALLVSSFGGPRAIDQVRPFLEALFSDRDAIRLPLGPILQRPLARWIARRRAPRSAAQYRAIGGASPLPRITLEQSATLEARLRARGNDALVFTGMRYGTPGIGDALDAALAAGARRIVCLALYPQYSIATTGSAFNAVARHLAGRRDPPPRLHFVPAFYRSPGYLDALAERIATALRAAPGGSHLLFSAHGIPAAYARRLGDPYPRQIQETVALVLPRIEALLGAPIESSLAWQSRVGPARWIGPSTAARIRSLAREERRSVVVAPISFVCDHLETLFEIDIEYARLAAEVGITHFSRSAALDGHPRFLDALVEAVAPALAGDVPPCCEICLLPLQPRREGRCACHDCGHRPPLWRRWNRS